VKGRQVGFVLIALIAIGVAGLIGRVVSSDSDQIILSGLLPLAQDVVDRMEIKSDESGTELIRQQDTWFVGNEPVFVPKMFQFWTAVTDIDGAQLIATNPANHETIGVADGQGTVVALYLGAAIQEQFIVSECTPQSLLCYLRRSGKDEVYGIPYPAPPISGADIFDTDPNGWRNPVVAAIPKVEVESVTFTYPEGEFALTLGEGIWLITAAEGQAPADFFAVDQLLSVLEVLIAQGFASAGESQDLKFEEADAVVRIVTREGATAPTTSIRFLVRDDNSFYVRTPLQPTVFVMAKQAADLVLVGIEDLIFQTGQ
jgi:hypothetical protein